jgi:hypothetical protein
LLVVGLGLLIFFGTDFQSVIRGLWKPDEVTRLKVYAVRDLNRSTVSSLLHSGISFPYSITTEIPIGNEVDSHYLRPDNNYARQYRQRTFDCLIRLGYISVASRQKQVGFFGWPVMNVSVTDKGRTLGQMSKQESFRGYFTDMAFKFGSFYIVVKEIAGVKMTSDSTATADFQWQRKNYTEVDTCMFISDTDVVEGQVALAKYDDGWRIEVVDFDKGKGCPETNWKNFRIKGCYVEDRKFRPK